MGGAIADAFATAIEWVKSAIEWVKSLASRSIPQWIKDTAGVFGIQLSADPSAVQSLAGGVPAYMTLDAQPAFQLSAVMWDGLSAIASATQQRPTIVEITVNGALDPHAVARQIRGLLRDSAEVRGADVL